jgi:LAO/AO transport system kinase
MGRPASQAETAFTAGVIDRLARRDRRTLAQWITRIENGEQITSVLQALPAPADGAVILGITGSAGVGKSTLVAALIEHWRAAGKTVAVLACDPQSPLSGGSLLGDRIRTRFEPGDEGVYFRSLSTRGAPGGLSQAVGPASELLARCGFDRVVVETVGVGQDEVAVRAVAEVVALLVAPGMGDEVQWQKAGLIEVVDLVVVNKADLPGAEALAAELRETLGIGDAATQEVIQVSATSRVGVAAFVDRVEHLASDLPTLQGRAARRTRSAENDAR